MGKNVQNYSDKKSFIKRLLYRVMSHEKTRFWNFIFVCSFYPLQLNLLATYSSLKIILVLCFIVEVKKGGSEFPFKNYP